MNLAIFTDPTNANLLAPILRKHSKDISVLFVFEFPAPAVPAQGVYFFSAQSDRNYTFLAEHHIDCVLVYGWNHKLPLELVTHIPCYNIHPSLLPKYRGPVPAIFQLLNREEISGVTIHKMDGGFDTGDIYRQKGFRLAVDETLQTLNMKITRCAFHLINMLLEDLIHLRVELHPQEESQASYYSYRDLEQYIVTDNSGTGLQEEQSEMIPYQLGERIVYLKRKNGTDGSESIKEMRR